MQEKKSFVVKMSKELWSYIKRRSIDEETSMNEIVNETLAKWKTNQEKKLTDKNIKI